MIREPLLHLIQSYLCVPSILPFGYFKNCCRIWLKISRFFDTISKTTDGGSCMHQFMTCFSFEEDELLASWILRLSKGNALSPAQFINSYVVDIPKYSGYRITTDYRLPFERFYRSLPIRADEVNLFLSTSTFCGTAPFMPTEQRQKYLNCAFNLNDSLSPLFPQPHGTAATFSVCPVCAETELNQLGHWYLHRACIFRPDGAAKPQCVVHGDR